MMHGGKTGYPAGLLQDDHTKLSKWFASKPDARMIVRQVCKEILEKKHDHTTMPRVHELTSDASALANIHGKHNGALLPQYEDARR
jgi:hypothetical protein